LVLAPLSLSQIATNRLTPKSEAQQPAPPANSKPAETEKNAAQIELLETKYRFETNGDSRKEVHTRVRINNELGVRQFGRLNFDFNRSFQAVEIPLVRITHPSGGIADILPSAITDNPNPAVVDAPAYLDVRVKSVRILGLQPGDLLEYRVITSTTHHPLAPDFWLDHSFDRTGVVTEEIFDVDLPASRKPEIRISPATPAKSIAKSGEGEVARIVYRWNTTRADWREASRSQSGESPQIEPDIALSTQGWESLSIRLDEKLTPGAKPLQNMPTYEESTQEAVRRQNVAPEITAKALELTKAAKSNREKIEDLYDFVSQKVITIDLPLGATEFVARPAGDVLASGYATPEDKFVLFRALAEALQFNAEPVLTGFCEKKAPARPSAFKHMLISAYYDSGEKRFLLDPSMEVAPFGLIPPNSGDCAFVLNRGFLFLSSADPEWRPLKVTAPFLSVQKVMVSASLDPDGQLAARVHYALRGDNELLLRVAFHKTPKEKWKEVAQLLAISDGFRGQIKNVSASDPYATKEPFTVEYEISQPKFVDWSKKTVHIPALLPSPGLPDPTSSSRHPSSTKSIELGTPLAIDLEATVKLPDGTSVQVPTGTSVERDYAKFSSLYSAQGNTFHAIRKLDFLLNEIPATRASDLNAFLHAVQADQTQLFTLQRAQSLDK